VQQYGEVLPGIGRIPEQQSFAIRFGKRKDGEEG